MVLGAPSRTFAKNTPARRYSWRERVQGPGFARLGYRNQGLRVRVYGLEFGVVGSNGVGL